LFNCLRSFGKLSFQNVVTPTLRKRLATFATNDIKESMIKFFLGLVVGIGLLLLAGYLFATRGGISLATKGGPLPMERSVPIRLLPPRSGKAPAIIRRFPPTRSTFSQALASISRMPA
jgi:hypothetical protein